MIDGVLLDLSGVLYVGDKVLPGAQQALQRLQSSGLPLRFVTNTTRSPRTEIVRKLQGMGLAIDPDHLYSAPMAALHYLREQGLRAHLLVHPALLPEFNRQPFQGDDAVLVGDAGETFTYAHLNEAFRKLMDGAQLLAMGRNRYFREADGLSLDAGPFVAALENAAGVEAIILGKPATEFFHSACAAMETDPERTVMIGDDVEADVNGATRAGLRGVLVRTGKYRDGDEQQLEDVDALVFPDLAAAVDWLLSRQR